MATRRRTGGPIRPAAGVRDDLTIKDIARMAGVSVATVSRVINGSGFVTAEKHDLVQEVLSRVNYIPNNAARALVSRRTRAVGLIVPTLANPLFAPTIAGVENRLRDAGYGLFLACSDRSARKELDHARTMIEHGVDGIILNGSHRHRALLPLLAARGIAVVSVDDPIGTEGVQSIAMPDPAAMACAIDALVAAGHDRIAILTGPLATTPAIQERLRGARDRLAEHGRACAPGAIVETPDYSMEAARSGAATLLALRPRPTAIACTGDILAIGVVDQCRRLGLDVPGDISVVGCGQTVMAQFVTPELTTVRLPFRELGEAGAERLLCLIDRQRHPRPPSLPYSFVPGATVSPPKA